MQYIYGLVPRRAGFDALNSCPTAAAPVTLDSGAVNGSKPPQHRIPTFHSPCFRLSTAAAADDALTNS